MYLSTYCKPSNQGVPTVGVYSRIIPARFVPVPTTNSRIHFYRLLGQRNRRSSKYIQNAACLRTLVMSSLSRYLTCFLTSLTAVLDPFLLFLSDELHNDDTLLSSTYPLKAQLDARDFTNSLRLLSPNS